MVDFTNLIRHLTPKIAHCVYRKFERVEKICEKHQFMRAPFDGCMVGFVDKDGTPMKKPWAIHTDCDQIWAAFEGLTCDGNHAHVQGRGKDLKETEGCSYRMTDLIHQAFIAASSSKTRTSSALCALTISNFTIGCYRRFPEAEVKEADYTAAADAVGLRPGEQASSSDDTTGPNGKARQSMLNNIFSTVTQCRVVNESGVISDLTALADSASNQEVASGYLQDISLKRRGTSRPAIVVIS